MLVSLISKEIEQNTNNEYALRTSGTGINHWNLTFVEPKKLSKNYLLLKEELHNTLVNNRHYVRQSQSKVISESTDGWQFTAKTRLNEWRQKKKLDDASPRPLYKNEAKIPWTGVLPSCAGDILWMLRSCGVEFFSLHPPVSIANGAQLSIMIFQRIQQYHLTN